MDELTSKQKNIYHFIKWFICEHQKPPTRKEIAQEFRFVSDNAAQEHLIRIEKKGFISLGEGNRNIKVLGFQLIWDKG